MNQAEEAWRELQRRAAESKFGGIRADSDDLLHDPELREALINPNAAGGRDGEGQGGTPPPMMMAGMGGSGAGPGAVAAPGGAAGAGALGAGAVGAGPAAAGAMGAARAPMAGGGAGAAGAGGGFGGGSPGGPGGVLASGSDERLTIPEGWQPGDPILPGDPRHPGGSHPIFPGDPAYADLVPGWNGRDLGAPNTGDGNWDFGSPGSAGDVPTAPRSPDWTTTAPGGQTTPPYPGTSPGGVGTGGTYPGGPGSGGADPVGGGTAGGTTGGSGTSTGSYPGGSYPSGGSYGGSAPSGGSTSGGLPSGGGTGGTSAGGSASGGATGAGTSGGSGGGGDTSYAVEPANLREAAKKWHESADTVSASRANMEVPADLGFASSAAGPSSELAASVEQWAAQASEEFNGIGESLGGAADAYESNEQTGAATASGVGS